MGLAALRGAVQIESDTPAAIQHGVARLMDELFNQNRINEDQVISVFFSQTADLTSFNPATASRLAGYSSCAYFCLQELEVEGSLERTIRVLIHVENVNRGELIPVYLEGAKQLRPDLFD